MENNFYNEDEINKISKPNTNYDNQNQFTTTYNIQQRLKGSYLCDDIENKETRESLNAPFQSGIIEINDSQNIETEEKNEQKIFYIDSKKDNKFDSITKKEVTTEKVDEKNISYGKSVEKKRIKNKFITKNEKIKKIFFLCKKIEKIKKGRQKKIMKLKTNIKISKRGKDKNKKYLKKK